LDNRKQRLGEKSNQPQSLALSWPNPFHIAVIVEDLRLPLDEGAKKTNSSLIYTLIKKGIKVSVFTRYENPLLKNVFPLPGNKFLAGCQFSRNLRAQAPDIILYIPASSGTIGAFVRAANIKLQAFGIPLALLNLQYRKLPTFTRFLGLHRFTDIVFTQSQASTEVFRSFGCKTVLLPGGVDSTIFQPVNRKEKRLLRLKYGFKDSDQIVLHVGHCNRNRNVGALTRLVKSGFKVIMIASTSTTIDCDLIVELRQSGVAVITNFIKNIQHYYQLADCYVFPVFCVTSAIDAPLSVLEAMACNLPIVTTRFGALLSMFKPGNGFYFGDTEEEILHMVKQTMDKQDCRTSKWFLHILGII
jgi:glycosyltransferase involved in cell wall biosynthesis